MSAMDHTQHDSTNIRGYYSWTDTLKGVYCTLYILCLSAMQLSEGFQMGLDVLRQRSHSSSTPSVPNARSF
jgi:hypothetical protein